MGLRSRQALYCFDSLRCGGYYSPPMSVKTLPEYLDLRMLAEQEAILAGQIPNRFMRRLRESMAEEAGETEAELRFAFDPVRRPTVEGWAKTELALVCQRCLEVYQQPLSVGFSLVLVRGEVEEELLGEEVEALLHDSDRVRTVDLLEDELILALPIVAMHADEKDCQVQTGEVGEQSAISEPAEPQKPNPFAALEALKRKQD